MTTLDQVSVKLGIHVRIIIAIDIIDAHHKFLCGYLQILSLLWEIFDFPKSLEIFDFKSFAVFAISFTSF
jgi:hypothetical protein